MEISTIILSVLVIASCVLNLIVLSRLAKISDQLTMPTVKKLTPEIKLKNVKRQLSQEGASLLNKKQKRDKEPSERSERNDKFVKNDKTEKSDRVERPERVDRNDKNDRNSKNRNRGRNRNRNKTAPEVFGNEAFDAEENFENQSEVSSFTEEYVSVAGVADDSETVVPEFRRETPEFRREPSRDVSNRPALEPRGQSLDVSNTESQSEERVSSIESASVDVQEKIIRHGRRTQIKR